MSDLDQMIEQLRRMRARPEAAERDWYRIQAKADDRKAEVRIYDDIGWMGTSAKTFAQEIEALDVDQIEVRLNSPGGDAWDGIAIYNTLRDHKARVTVVVDGMAASAASVIAMAGDTVRMNRGAQMMIHDAWGLAIGNAADMAETAAMLGKCSDSLASIYAGKAGGTVEEWRAAMAAESWYTAQEAVDAGLADELVDAADPANASARWDVKAYAFAHAGRAAAPAPVMPRRPESPKAEPISAAEAARRIHAASTRNPKEASVDAAKIREALGLAADAPDNEVKAALASAGLVDQPDPPEPATGSQAAPDTKPRAAAPGTMTVDVSAWQDREDRLKRLEAQAAKARADERDQIIDSAIRDGKFAPARREHWARLWDADPEGTREVIETLAKNVVPVAELGYGHDSDESIDDEFRHLFPPATAGKGA